MAFIYKNPKEVEDAQKKVTTDTQALNDFKFYKPGEYTQSDDLKKMWDTISNWKTPTWDKSNNTWWNKLTETTNALENREKFSYDVNGDALYQQYKDQYTTQGNMAMMDTMGQAAAMTGGYGNSYAQSVGQQTYQGYMQQLTDKIPELWQMAYNKYNQEGQELKDRISIYDSLYNTEYGEHRDAVTDSQNERSTLLNMYGIKSDEDYRTWYDSEQFKVNASEQDYKKLSDLLGISIDQAKTLYDMAYQYQLDTYKTTYQEKRDAVADTQWQTQFDYQKTRDQVSDNQWKAEFDEMVKTNNQSITSKAQQTAADNCYAAIESGVMPSDAMIKAAGLDKTVVQNMVNARLNPAADAEEAAKLKAAENSTATKAFISGMPTGREWSRFSNGSGYKMNVGNGETKRFDTKEQYYDYALEKAYKSGQLTEYEVAYLKGYYGIE